VSDGTDLAAEIFLWVGVGLLSVIGIVAVLFLK
jgi:hypothetical protein